MHALAPRTLEDGEYTTQLLVRESDTIVEAAFNTTFSVVATRLRVNFVDGTERKVDRDGNVTLRAEVASSSPNFTLRWDCSPWGNPGQSCFREPGIINSLPTTTSVGDNLFDRLHHLWELLHNESNSSDNQRKSHSHSSHYLPPFFYTSNFSSSEEWSFLHRVFNTSKTYIVTLTFPASILVPTHDRLLFSASVEKHLMHHYNATQLVVLASSEDNIGIKTCLGSQFPFGALRRMVFESNCMSCTAEELAQLRYTWSLKVLVNVHSFSAFDLEHQAIAVDETEAVLQRILKRNKVDGSFLPRPRDYLRVYNISTSSEESTQTTPKDDFNLDLVSTTPYLSTHDLENLPGIITPEIVAQAAEAYHRWGRPTLGFQNSPSNLSNPYEAPKSHRKQRWQHEYSTTLTPKATNKKPLQLVDEQSILRNYQGSEGTWVSGSASATKNHARRSQRMKRDSISSSQADMRRKVVGRHSGAANQGPVTDETLLSVADSPAAPASAFVKVKLDNHLVRRTPHISRQGWERKGPGTHPHATEWPSLLLESNSAFTETEQGRHTNSPDHRHRVNRNSGAEKSLKIFREGNGGPWVAEQRVDRGGSRRSGVKWEAMGKVFDSEEAAQRHQVIQGRKEIQRSHHFETAMKEREIGEKEKRMWSDDNDGGVHDSPAHDRRDKQEGRRLMTKTVLGEGGVQAEANVELEQVMKHNAFEFSPDTPMKGKKDTSTQSDISKVWSARSTITQKAQTPVHSGRTVQIETSTRTALNSPDRSSFKVPTSKTDSAVKGVAGREWQIPHWQRPENQRVPATHVPPQSRPSLSVESKSNNKGNVHYSYDTGHGIRVSEDLKISGPHQRRVTQVRDWWGRVSSEAIEQTEKRTDLQGFDEKIQKRRKQEKLNVNLKPAEGEEGMNMNRQEVAGDGAAASRHAIEQEVGYREKYLTAGSGVKVATDDANDAPEAENDVGSASEARQLARTSHPPAHQQGDSAHTPVGPALPPSPVELRGATTAHPEFLAAAGLSWDERESRQSTVRGGGGKVRGSEPSHFVSAAPRPPRPQPDPALFSSSAHLEYQDIPTAPPRGPNFAPNFRVFHYDGYKKMKSQSDRRKLNLHATPGQDRHTENPTRKAGRQGSAGKTEAYGPPLHRIDGKAPNHTTEDGMEEANFASQSSHARLEYEDHLEEEHNNALSFSQPDSRLTTTSAMPTDTPWYTTQKNTGWNAVEAAGGDWGFGSGLAGGGQGEAGPQGFPRLHSPPREGQAGWSRGPDYIEELADFVNRTGELPDLDCRAERWDECQTAVSSRSHVNTSLTNALGDPLDERMIIPNIAEDKFVTDETQISVVLFGELTSTGTHNPVLVLYMDLLSTSMKYILYLTTYNSVTNTTGSARQLIEFSPAPTLRNCQVIPLAKAKSSYFRASCSDVDGYFYPVMLQWSYRFLRLGTKTIFYHGARPSFDFPLPSGLDSNDYKVYVSVKAIDGKGVSYKYSDFPALKVLPRVRSGIGVLSIFKEISTLENESPPLLLQAVRSLAWELNIVTPSHITQTIVDNILTILFYQTSCKDMLETASDTLFVKINLLKSCARDHLAEKVANNPIRDEMEVIQALTAVQIIIDTNENISSTTYLRVLSAMDIAANRMWFSYFVETRTEAAQQYFILSSAMLDKQKETYDGNITSISLTSNIITNLLDIMEVETSARFREESPLSLSTSTLTFYGYWAESENINKWNDTVPILFEPDSDFLKTHLVQALVHTASPFHLPVDPITSEVVWLDTSVPYKINLHVHVKLRHSLKHAGQEQYDFRRDGVVSPESLTVYEFMVENKHQNYVLNVLLQVTRVFSSQYPVAAVVLICHDLQSLKQPLYKQELMATVDPSEVMLSVPPNELSNGKKLLVIMDKNSYENNLGTYNVSSALIGADFKVAGWWSRCFVWDNSQWDGGPCSVDSKSSSWDSTMCNCHSKHSVYGAQTIPVLDEESKVDVNELMLVETYIALYFVMMLLVIYFFLALAVQTSDRHRLRRRNIWLRDNKLEHEWAYLLTIKTGTQWNAGTTSKVYAILHGTHGMSETRELQSKQTGQLFTRGALCTFILTTPEPLGDILKVQVWHDNSGGSESGWFVCETSVADLVLGAIYIYPCYRWLSVQAEDAKVEREITLESPTTFMQDFEHFLPQYASEHMLWTSLLTTSSTAKFYRLQRLTICLIVCLCLGTVSLGVVKRINKEHTMMVPDMHIEPLYYGVIIAVALLPVQWMLEMIFKMSNKVEEKEYNAKAVLDTLKATQSEANNAEDTKPASDVHNGSGEDNVYDPQSEIWKSIRKWSLSTEVSSTGAGMLHPTFLRDLEVENMEVSQRSRSSTGNKSRISQSDNDLRISQPESLVSGNTEETSHTEIHESSQENGKKRPSITRLFTKALKQPSSLFSNTSESKQYVQEDWEGGEDEDYDDDDAEKDDLRVGSSSITFIFSQCVGWIVCCIFVALCCMVLYAQGSGMPMDYCAVWIHIIYVTLCCSVFIMQPLVVIIYTFYKVCVYRWLGCRGCISSCITVPLDQVVDIWNRYQTALRRQAPIGPSSSNEKLLEERKRTRELRSAHPPSEDYLLKCREKEIRQEKVYNLFRNTLGHLVLLVVLVIIANNMSVYKQYTLNTAILSSLKNGSCLDSARFEDPCTMTNGVSCNQKLNKDYITFDDIRTKDNWWNWAFTELLALTYSNHDESFSSYNIFCDTNSIIIGQPRLRKYDSTSKECEASKFKIDSNRSMADLLKVGNCFPNYVDEVQHFFSFGSDVDKEYVWDAHFLAVTHGQYGQYSYTSYKQFLSASRFSTVLTLYLLQASNWLNNNGTRAVVVEFTLYHPQTNMYTTLNLLAEFPSLSGAKVETFISSSHIERYENSSRMVFMLAETLLLAVAMYYFKRTAVYIYTCRFRIWKSFWGLLDVLMTIFSMSYAVCLMLRVQIAEDVMWLFRVAYFQKFVNLKGLTTWDEVLQCLIGCMLGVHLLRCLSLLKYLPRSYHLGLVLANAWKDVRIISGCMLVILIALMNLGLIWFSTLLWEFRSHTETALSIIKIVMVRLPFLETIEENANGLIPMLAYLYYLLTFIFLYQLMRGLYVAAFLNARKEVIDKPGVDVTWNDVRLCLKERYHSLLQRIRRKKKEEENLPADNTPPDFYMAELELQISQVMNGLESLAESFGLIVDRVNRLDDSTSSYSDFSETDDNYSYSNDEIWQQDSESRSSTYATDDDNKWQLMQHQHQGSTRDYDYRHEINQLQGARPKLKNDAVKGHKVSVDRAINLDAFTDIESCQTDIETLSHKWNSALGDHSFDLIDDGGTLEKFLKDVSESFDNFTSFGKYGKTQLRVSTKIHPSHESLNLSQNNSGVTENAISQKGIHTENVDGCIPRGISSRLCRTQTQGRGKGHVDALDITCLESDYDDDE